MVAAAALLLAGTSRAQEITDPASGQKVITSIAEFWGMSGPERAKRHPYRIECDVTHYDATWNNLWIQDATQSGYVSVGNRKLPIKSGQRIIITGTFEPPNRDLSFEHGTVIATSPANTPVLEAGGMLGRSDLFQSRLVTLDAFVVSQYRIDPEHLQMTLSAEGETITGVVTRLKRGAKGERRGLEPVPHPAQLQELRLEGRARLLLHPHPLAQHLEPAQDAIELLKQRWKLLRQAPHPHRVGLEARGQP